MAWLRPLSQILFWSTVVGISCPAVAKVLRNEWDPVPGAEYYEATIALPSGATRIRTTDHWILLPDVDKVTVDAYDKNKKFIKQVHTHAIELQQKPVTKAPQKPAAPVATAAPVVQPSPPPVAEADPFAGYEKGKGAYGETDTPDSVLEEPSPPEEPTSSEVATSSPDSKTPTGTAHAGRMPLAQTLSVTLGLGKESLVAKGGVSDFNGSANFGGLAISGEMRFGSRWLGMFQFGAHNFSTSVSSEDQGTGTTTTDDAKFLRTSARGIALYDFNAPDGASTAQYTLGLGLGVGYFRLPVLAVKDDATGGSGLTLRAAMGPTIAAYYARYLTTVHTFGAAISFMPSGFSQSTKPMGTNALLFWRYAYEAHLFTELALVSAKESLATHNTCPNVADCTENGLSTSSATSARMGIGLTF